MTVLTHEPVQALDPAPGDASSWHPSFVPAATRPDLATRLGAALDEVAARAVEIRPFAADPSGLVADLASAGLLDLEIDALVAGRLDRYDVRPVAAVVSGLARECLSSALVAVGHRLALEYLARGRRTATNERLLRALRRGVLVGASALPGTPVRGRLTEGGGLVLDGRLPWVTNLVPGAVVLVPVELADGRRLVAWLGRDDPGVRVETIRGLPVLDATAPGALVLTGVEVSAEEIVLDEGGDEDEVHAPVLGVVEAQVGEVLAALQTSLAAGLAARPGGGYVTWP